LRRFEEPLGVCIVVVRRQVGGSGSTRERRDLGPRNPRAVFDFHNEVTPKFYELEGRRGVGLAPYLPTRVPSLSRAAIRPGFACTTTDDASPAMSERYHRVNNDDDDAAPVRHYTVNRDGVARLRSATPSLPVLPNLDFNDIDNAISRMQSQFSASGSVTSPTRPSQLSPSATSPNQAIPSPGRRVSSMHNRGESSAETVVGDNTVERMGKDGYEYLKYSDDHEQIPVESADIANQPLYAAQHHQQQQSGYLPTVHSGTTLRYQSPYLPNPSPDFMYQADPYGRPLSVVSGTWDGSRPASAAFPYHTPTGSVGYASTAYNVPVLSAYYPDTEYASQSDFTHINHHADPFLLPAHDSRSRSPTPEMEFVRVEKDPEADVPLTTPGTAELESPKVDTKHYGPAPVGKQVRRRKTKKKVPLTKGHLVLELPVPSRLLLPYKPEPEMTHTRWVIHDTIVAEYLILLKVHCCDLRSGRLCQGTIQSPTKLERSPDRAIHRHYDVQRTCYNTRNCNS
jgi:Chitin synthase N-terminal